MRHRPRTRARAFWRGPAAGRSGPPGGEKRRQRPWQSRALAIVMTAGLLAAQPGGWTGAPSGDGGAAVPDAWLLLSDAAFAGLLPGYAFAQSVTQTLSLTAADSVDRRRRRPRAGRRTRHRHIHIPGGSTYAAVAADSRTTASRYLT